jgi:DNA-binding IclR family transcriptional regulator
MANLNAAELAKGPKVQADNGVAAAEEPTRVKGEPQNHRTVDRVTQILEEVVYHPGMTFVELVRALGAAKSSVHGFIQGLVAKGWLYEEQHRFYLGPAVYGLTLASGHIRAGLVTHADLALLHEETRVPVFLGVQAGEHLIYIAEAGSDDVTGFEARSNIRRTLLSTAGGKALLAARGQFQRETYLRRCNRDESELVDRFLQEFDGISKSRIATNINVSGTRFGLATTVHNRAGEALASVTLVGSAADVKPRLAKLSKILLKHVDSWAERSLAPREAI